MANCGTCGGDGVCRTCWGAGFIYSRGQQVTCQPHCGPCSGTGRTQGDGKPNTLPDGGGKGGKGGGKK